MDLTEISPDEVVYWSRGWFAINATLVFTWVTMALLVLAAVLATGRRHRDRPRFGTFLELVLTSTLRQIRAVADTDPRPLLPFVATLFLFIASANALMVIPGFVPPTASLSTTAALAICVFVAVPTYGIARDGVRAYFGHYVRPSVFMLPFHVIGELSRTLALAVRLFGNVMSGTKIAAILLAVVPFVFPVVLQALGLLTGLIQAYIFAVLAIVYIASQTRAHEERAGCDQPQS